MSWLRILVAVVIALPVGALAGRYYAARESAPALAALEKERAESAAAARAMRGEVDEAKEKAESLARENRRLQDQLASAAKAEPEEDPSLEPVGAQGEMTLDSGAEQPADASGAGRDPRRGGNPNETDAEREARIAQWREEREQRGAEMRDRLRSFIDEQIQNAPDKTTQDRLTSISANGEAMMDLFQQMREAQTDEERDAVRDELRTTGDATRQLVQEQQDYLMRESLRQSGVTDPKAQDAAMQSLRQTMEGPFFRGPLAWGGGGGPGGPGGFDGGGFFGGRGRGPGSGRGPGG
ncbi:MAG: hypothetical protein FJY92_01735 [Candidatus Hydrogenedentes bacterium]|nr:hypothetical protein [Candidatus Hydrogenedentota bacterium]